MRQNNETIIQYVQNYGDQNFWSLPFSDVDSLVFATLCYANLELTPFAKIGNFNCTIRELGELADLKQLTWPMWSRERGEQLMTAAAKSRRYGEIVAHHYRHHLDSDAEKQFTAITFTINTDMGYVDIVTFQGTDDTLVGWKEDLNMTFARHLPSQLEAVSYLEEIAASSDNKLILTGHSKGGNLAVYAAHKVNRQIKDRIIDIYDHDGPGFLPRTFTTLDKIGVAGKVHKIIPASSFFGLLLDSHPSSYKVVKSNSRYILQHDGLSWLVDGDHFATLPSVTMVSKYTARTIRRWLISVDPKQRKQCVDAIFAIFAQSHSATAQGFKHYLATNLKSILMSVKNSDPLVRKVITDTFKLLAKSSWDEAKATVKNKVHR